MGRKKILHVVEAFGGGVYTYMLELAKSTCEEYDVVIAYKARPQTPMNFREEFGKNVKFIEVKDFSRNIGMQDLKALKEIKKIIKQEKPDIVHLHSAKAGIIGRFAINDRNIKMFYTPHGYSFLKLDDSKVKRTMYKLVEHVAAFYNKNCTTIACSEGEYNQAMKIRSNCRYVNNGIDTNKIDKMNFANSFYTINTDEYEDRKLKICTVGRIDTQKNPKCFNEIALNFPDDEFIWIGEGNQRNFLTSSNIKITGWLSNEKVIEKMAECDIFLLPSLWEGLPMSLLEAMYLKKLCLVSNISGNNNVIKNGVNGFICNTNQDFSKIINEIKDKKFDLKTISNNAKNSVLTQYNSNVMSEQYKNIYKEFSLKSTEIIGFSNGSEIG